MTGKSRFLLLATTLIAILAIAVLLMRGRSEVRGTSHVGVLMPLTGGAASLGTSCRNGVLLAVEQYNASRSDSEPQVALLIEDTKADPSTAVSGFHKLTTAHEIKTIIGPLASGPTLAVAPLAERTSTIILSPGASTPSVSEAGDFVFRNELSEAFGAREQARLAFELLGFRTIALLYVNNAYGSGTATEFRKNFLDLGGGITLDEAFNPGSTDFRTVITAIRRADPDAVYFVYQDDIVNFMRQRAELGMATPVYTTPVFETPSNLQDLGELAEGVIYAYYGDFDPAVRTGPAVSFVSSYTDRFSQPPSYYSALGYDAARIIIEGLRRCGFVSEGLKDSLYSIQGFVGVTGNTSFDDNGDVQKPVTLRTVRRGHFVKF